MTAATDIYKSERLIYRAVEDPEDDDLLVRTQRDPSVQVNTAMSLHRPLSRKDVLTNLKKILLERSMMAVVICLAPSKEDQEGEDAPTPIGFVCLRSGSPEHHREASISIEILPAYQGKGYGSEAIRWTLRWGFRRAGLHRVAIESFGHNEVATRLYEKLGFVPEGRRREAIFYDGRWYDFVMFGMLEGEWRAMEERLKK